MFPICWRRLARSNAGSSSAATRSWAALISDKFPYGRQQRSRKARRPMGLRVVRTWTRASLRPTGAVGSLNFEGRQHRIQPKPPVGGDDLWGLQVTEFGGPVTGGLRVLRV